MENVNTIIYLNVWKIFTQHDASVRSGKQTEVLLEMAAGIWIRGPKHCPGLLCSQVAISEN